MLFFVFIFLSLSLLSFLMLFLVFSFFHLLLCYSFFKIILSLSLSVFPYFILCFFLPSSSHMLFFFYLSFYHFLFLSFLILSFVSSFHHLLLCYSLFLSFYHFLFLFLLSDLRCDVARWSHYDDGSLVFWRTPNHRWTGSQIWPDDARRPDACANRRNDVTSTHKS